MSPLPRSIAVRAVAAGALLWAIGLTASCKEKEQSARPSTDTEPAAAPTVEVPKPAEPSRTIDPSYVPTDALEQLEGTPLESDPPCSDTIETLEPALDAIAAARRTLEAATTEAEVVQLLTALSDDLTARLPSIASRSETDELRRISAELTASVGDLAESLKLASDALTAQDRQASATVLRRLHNGVANIRSSIERLIAQCAS